MKSIQKQFKCALVASMATRAEETPDLMERLEKVTYSKTGKLGSGYFKHLTEKRMSKCSKKYIKGSKPRDINLER